MTDALRGKVALVTGAGRGIGAAIAEHFEEAGCFVYRADIDPLPGPLPRHVPLHGRPRERENRSPSLGRGQGEGHAATIRLDVTDREAVRVAVERIARDRGALDILVNNAGVLATGPSDKTSGEEWDRLLAVNVTGVFNCVQAAVPAMRGRAGSSIVNIASVSAEKGGGAIGNVWYGATKAAVVAMTRGLGRELGPQGIRVNAIAPAVLDTPMVHDMLTPDRLEKVLARIPLGRLASAADVARLAVFLASDAAAFITGETIAVDGGFLLT